jgi:hypothetical protein
MYNIHMSQIFIAAFLMVLVSCLSIASTSIGIDMHRKCGCDETWKDKKNYLIVILIFSILGLIAGMGMPFMLKMNKNV